MLTTLNYTETATKLSGEIAINVAAGLFSSLERACNRRFARLVECVDIVTGGASVDITQYRHRLRPGQKVSVSSTSRASKLDLSGVVIQTAGFGRDQFRLPMPDGVTIEEDDLDGLEFFVRPHWSEIRRTKSGSTSCFVQQLPLSEIITLSIPDGEGGWEALATDKYTIAGVTQDESSIVGEIALLDSSFGGALNGDDYHPAGVKIDYVAGEPEPPEDAIFVMREMLKNVVRRNKDSDFQSESYDYYSYSRLSAGEIGKLFGEAERIIAELHIPA